MNGPRLIIVGTTDVDARIELMRRLHPDYRVAALGSGEDLGPEFAKVNLPYYRYHMSRRANPVGDLKSLHGLFRIFRNLRPDIVHTFDTKPCVLGRIAARLARVPVVVGTITGIGTLYVDNSPKTRILRTVYQPLQRLACHLSNMTIFYNHHDISYFLTAGIVPSDRCTVVPGSGIATNKFRKDKILPEELLRVRKDLNLKDGEIVVIMIARICRSKGVLEFAQAAEIVRQKMPWVRFILVGPVDDNALDRLSALEMDYICKSVTWVGVRKDIEPILAVSDVFALPTYREGIPRVLLEAASMSLPIVATDTPGCQEVVQHEVNGFLIPTRDAEALAREIERLAENNKLRASFGAASRKLAITEFDIEIISEKIANLYCYCLNNINTRSLCPAKPEKVIIA